MKRGDLQDLEVLLVLVLQFAAEIDLAHRNLACTEQVMMYQVATQ